MKRQTILLTGGTGFLGSHLLRALVGLDRYHVVLLKRSTSSCSRIEDVDLAHVTPWDSDGRDVRELFAAHPIEVVIHAATEYGRASTPITGILGTNLILPIAILEEGIGRGLKLFVNTDSYFNKDNFSYSTLLDYSLSKRCLNIWLRSLSEKVRVANMRVEHVFGEDDSPSKFVEEVVQRVAVRREPRMALTYCHQRRDFVYVADVVNAYLKVLETYESQHYRHRLFEVGTGASTPIRAFVEKVKELSGSPTALDFGALPYRHDEIMDSRADCSELLDLGWTCRYDYASGLARILGTYADRR